MRAPVQLAAAFAVFLSGATRVSAQGFVNLDFEQATIITNLGSAHQVSMALAMPGWTAYNNYLGSSVILYDTITLGSPAVSIHDTNTYTLGLFPLPIMQGRYTAALQPYFPSGTSPAAIGQVGTIPFDAQSLRFYASGTIAASFNGQPIPMFALQNNADYTIYGGNISSFAGQTGELRFQVANVPVDEGSALDNIFFSTQAVPEPSTLGLFVVGGAFLYSVAVRRKKG